MSDSTFHVNPSIAANSLVNGERYRLMSNHAANDPNSFWAEEAQRIAWIKPPTIMGNATFGGPGDPNVSIKWFEDGQLNASAACLDAHLATRGDQVAIIWEGDDPSHTRKVTYRELHEEVCRLANVLKERGVKRGDRVTIYLPMVVEAAVAMLACARVGAIHAIVFGGFSPDSLANRINGCDSTLLITADEGRRGGRKVALKANADEALQSCPTVTNVIVVRVTGGNVPMQEGRDHDYATLIAAASPECAAEPMGAEDPLFILFTSGSTGQPKGVVHTTGGYMVWASFTHQYVFDYHPGEVYWCTADVGWVTGHTYIVYGPLANGATTVMFEGIPNYPDSSRFWQVVDKHQVNIFYTAPTAIRSLMREGDGPVKATKRTSLRVLGSVGEPINPEAWMWYHRVVGDERCPIVDTWWQTETGAIVISPLPGRTSTKPGSATKPLPGYTPQLVSEDGEPMDEGTGILVMTKPWPSMLRTLYKDDDRFVETYFSRFSKETYVVGDAARVDSDGYYWIIGRIDDVINVSGHRLSTAEVESALVSHEDVAEAAVVGQADEDTGQAIVAFVTLNGTLEGDDDAEAKLREHVARKIGKLARPKRIIWTDDLPKTRSGKIMRRLLRDIAEGRALGDVTTLRDPDVMAALSDKVKARQSEG